MGVEGKRVEKWIQPISISQNQKKKSQEEERPKSVTKSGPITQVVGYKIYTSVNITSCTSIGP
jgi:hypothetical protein